MKFSLPTKIMTISLLSFGVVFMCASTSNAELVISEAQIRAIKTNCVNNQASLNQLRQSDTFLRIDRGNLYRTISDKLMVPLDRRLVANQLNASDLVKTTSDFNDEYRRFYTAYVEYDDALSKLLDIDCTKQPVAFYDALRTARTAREKVSDSNQKLLDFVRQFKSQFDAFRSDFLADKDNG